ncbi:DUF397 domain-containing protein [Streptomyces gobiensis]|uniref:DUF397 domain-containing protein n=1 Tax=Streptomyces gobiensis TaxID=2875706 RepID=UPI001E34FB4A|nr:DUF397 domain-containing protein [Streptomyces gobiensis]UGY94230.1 DUF397 domain-containing protein [Streptomyces gobiensis]
MSEIDWQEPFCGGGGNACLQLGLHAHGTPHLRETDRPGEILTTTPTALAALITTARRGDLDQLRRSR